MKIRKKSAKIAFIENILKAEIDPAFAARAAIIFNEVEDRKPKKILDAGCGRGFYVRALSFFPFIKEVHGFDINDKYVTMARQSFEKNLKPDSGQARMTYKATISLQQASIYSLPYPDNYFEFIICSEVLEHLEDDKKALLELKRVLKKNGTLIITVPNQNFPFLWDPLNWALMKFFNTHIPKHIWWLAGIWADHERLYAINHLKLLVKNVGFTLTKTEPVLHYCLPFSHFLLYGIGKNIVERFGIQSFNRFNFQKKPVAELAATIFRFPARFDTPKTLMKSSMNIVMKLTK